MSVTHNNLETMNCMEVRGGSDTSENAFRMPGVDVWLWSRQHGIAEAGGREVYFLSSCASGNITRMVIADLCAHGNSFSELASEFRDLMKQNINAIKQSRFVRDMNGKLQLFAERGAFATALISTYFAPTRTLSLCNVGHPPPLLFRAQENRWTVIKSENEATVDGLETPNGVIGDQEYQHYSSRLEPGDMMLSYSNALCECRDEKGSILGVDGILELVEHFHVDQPNRTISSLVSYLQTTHVDNLVADDATIMLCQATKTPSSFKNLLLSPFRLLKSVIDRTRLD